MPLGKSSDYGILATLHIAIHEKEAPVYGREIAHDCGIPPAYLYNILRQLARVGIISSRPGPGGGFTLAKPPRQITLLAIVEAIEGPLDEGLIPTSKIKVAERPSKNLQAVRKDIFRYARSRLGKTTIKQLMD